MTNLEHLYSKSPSSLQCSPTCLPLRTAHQVYYSDQPLFGASMANTCCRILKHIPRQQILPNKDRWMEPYTISVDKVEKPMMAVSTQGVIQIVQEMSTSVGILSQKGMCSVRFGHSDLFQSLFD